MNTPWSKNREGTLDQWIETQVPLDYGTLGITSGDRVLDIGAHIGHFTQYALDHGAAHVMAVEPEVSNWALLKSRFFDEPRVTPLRGAIIGEGPDLWVKLNVKQGSNTGAHSVVITGHGRVAVEVPAYTLSHALELATPSVIKIDIEGGEHAFDYTSLPLSVRAIAIEVMLYRKEWYPTGLARICGELAVHGFIAVSDPYARISIIRGKPWVTIGVWRR